MDFTPATIIPLTREQRETLEAELTAHAEKIGLRQTMSKTAFKKWLTQMIELPRQDDIYLSTDNVYQINVRKRSEHLVHLSIKRRDKVVVNSRADLVEIANVFIPTGCVGVELYPAQSRLVDTVNQYHVWSQHPAITADLLKLYENRHSMLEDRDGVRSTKIETPPVETREWRFTWLPHHGAHRDWRSVWEAKSAIYGYECEAVDVLFPGSAEEGVFLVGCTEPSFRYGFGFEKSPVMDEGRSVPPPHRSGGGLILPGDPGFVK